MYIYHKCLECGYIGEVKTVDKKVVCPQCQTINDVWFDGEEPPVNHIESDKLQMVKGWISFPFYSNLDDEKAYLNSMGITVGEFISNEKKFINCELNENAITELNKVRGYYEWGLL